MISILILAVVIYLYIILGINFINFLTFQQNVDKNLPKQDWLKKLNFYCLLFLYT